MTPLRGQWWRIAAALGVGAAGGAAAAFLHFPAPWLLGSLLAVAGASLAGAPVAVPSGVRGAILPLVGISLGSGVTPETIAGMFKWPASLGGFTLAVVLSVAASSAFLRHFGKWDRVTAFFASVPGVLSQVLVCASSTPANLGFVTLTHLFRMLMLMAILPLVASLSAHAPFAAANANKVVAGGWSCLGEIAGGYIAGYALTRMRIAGGWLLGGMIVAAAMHLSGVTQGQLPMYIVIPCHIAFGAFVGQRFRNTDFRLLRQAALPSAGAFLVTLAVLGLFAAAVAWSMSLPLTLVLVAFAPGALEVMAVMAFALGVDPTFVAAHHLARFIGVTVILPFAVRRYVE